MLSVKRLRTAARVLRTSGLRGVADVWRANVENSWLLGKYVELRGNRVTVEGLTFSVDSPEIRTPTKTAFVVDSYEAPEREALARFLDPDAPVVEFGGSIGVVACLTNRRLARPERHVVVEANPMLIPLLGANRDRNGCRFTILPRAVAYGEAEVAFFRSKFFVGSFARPPEELVRSRPADRVVRVPTTSLEAVLDAHGFERCTLVCDIEGGERELVAHEGAVLRERVRHFMVELHPHQYGADGAAALAGAVERLGFRRVFERESTLVFENAAADHRSATA
jgi:FkbM family methyltransferase